MPNMMEQFQRMANTYMFEHGRVSATELAAHAIRTGLWQPQPSDMIKQCARLFARAMRQEYFVDPQGRKVRAKHAAMLRGDDGEQTALWDDLRTATRQHMHVSFQQKREQILGECQQLKLAVDSYNDNQNDGEAIQLYFNFTEDLMELEAGGRLAA